MELNLNDLQPKEAEFELSGLPGVKLTLKVITLRTQIWLDEKYGAENIEGIFKRQSMKEISEICFHLLKDKSHFIATEDSTAEEVFQDACLGVKDRGALFTALMAVVGISQPVLEELAKAYTEASSEDQKKRLIGGLFSIALPASTPTTPKSKTSSISRSAKSKASSKK